VRATPWLSPLVLFVLMVACGGAPGGTPPRTPALAQARPLALGDTRAELTEADSLSADGRREHRWALALDPSVRVRIRMSSHAVDAALELLGPGDMHLRNDDAFPGTLDALLDFQPPVAATYELVATTAAPAELGIYSLRVTARPPGGTGPQVPLDGSISAALVVDPAAEAPGAWLQFDAQAGSIVQLWVRSSAFDTVATVFGPGGQTWMNDDGHDVAPDGRGGPLDSALTVAAPQTGTYQLVVTSYGLRDGGYFDVLGRSRPPVILREGEEVPAEGYAGPGWRGRIFGLYAGVTTYPDDSPLYGCADDARFLADAFRAAHLQAQTQQRVLLDAQATKAAFLGGIGWLAENASEDDLVVIFWSGHGTVQRAEEGDTLEVDGLDETIQLVDGRLTDTEVVAAIDAVRAGTTILAIDACHSGGFADDFMTRPGRLGLFSSDADVLSDTAEPRRAGGYLSWHLRRAVLGEADSRPRDGVLLAGELTDHIYEGFVEDFRSMNPGGSMEPLQRLVVQRGSVGWDRGLWVYPRRPDLSLPSVPSIPLVSAPP